MKSGKISVELAEESVRKQIETETEFDPRNFPFLRKPILFRIWHKKRYILVTFIFFIMMQDHYMAQLSYTSSVFWRTLFRIHSYVAAPTCCPSVVKRGAGLKGQCHEIFCWWFFYESVSPQPQSVLLGPFRTFSKIRGDIRSSRLTTGVADTGGKWKKSSIRKILIILLGHLWIVDLTYI